jgi:hypothetical protein
MALCNLFYEHKCKMLLITTLNKSVCLALRTATLQAQILQLRESVVCTASCSRAVGKFQEVGEKAGKSV